MVWDGAFRPLHHVQGSVKHASIKRFSSAADLLLIRKVSSFSIIADIYKPLMIETAHLISMGIFIFLRNFLCKSEQALRSELCCHRANIHKVSKF